jgi:hypothetical protein
MPCATASRTLRFGSPRRANAAPRLRVSCLDANGDRSVAVRRWCVRIGARNAATAALLSVCLYVLLAQLAISHRSRDRVRL